jgi:hypothetical protein
LEPEHGVQSIAGIDHDPTGFHPNDELGQEGPKSA